MQSVEERVDKLLATKPKRAKINFKKYKIASSIILLLVFFMLGLSLCIPAVQKYFSSSDIDTSPPTPQSTGDEPFNNTDNLGFELLDNGSVFHMWNSQDSYYFNRSNGIQFSNHYEEYWTRNVLMLGYHSGDDWNLLYRVDELDGFTEDLNCSTDDYINITLWKDLSYGGYDFRLAIRYHLGINDSDLTTVPYIKNLGIAIPFDIGFGWEMKDIQIDNNVENDQIRINGTSYLLNQTLDIKYTNITRTIYEYNETTNITTNYTVKNGEFYLENVNNITGNADKDLYLKWNPNLDYLVWVKSRANQYNAPTTLFIRVGTLAVGQEKSTELHWHDSDTLYERYITGGDGYNSATNEWYRGQTFTIGNTGTNENHDITSVKLLLFRVDSPGIITVSIRITDGDGKPTGNDLTDGTTDGNTLTTSAAGEWREITLTPHELVASTQYVILILGSTADQVGWVKDASSPSYTGGSHVFSPNSGSTWYVYSNDFLFEEYGTAAAPEKDWVTLDTWNITLSNTSSLFTIDTWNMTLSNISTLFNIDTWNVTLSNTSALFIIDVWNVTLSNTSIYINLDTWNITLSNTTQLLILDTWNITLSNTSALFTIDTWNITLSNTSSLKNIDTWNITLSNTTQYSILDIWNVTLSNTSALSTIDVWNVTLSNTSIYINLDIWNITLSNTSQLLNLDIWNITLSNTSTLKNIDIWNITLSNTTAYLNLDIWNITLSNSTSLYILDTWNITLSNTSKVFVNLEIWNVTLSNTTVEDIFEFYSIYPEDNATDICPCIDALCFGVNNTVGNNMNISIYRNDSHNETFYLVNKYLNITNGVYCFVIDGHMGDIYYPIKYNETYYWYVNATDVVTGNQTDSTIVNFTTATDPDDCLPDTPSIPIDTGLAMGVMGGILGGIVGSMILIKKVKKKKR